MMKKYSVVAFFVLLGLYVLFQARNLILGPRIVVKEPDDEAAIDAGIMEIVGIARNASTLSLDDRVITTDTQGNFREKLIAQPGVNIIKLEAKDRFGRETEKIVRVVAR